MFTEAFDAVLELSLLVLFLGVCGYAARLVLTTMRGTPASPPESNGRSRTDIAAPRDSEAPRPG